LSPHLQVYRLQMNMALSILHRLTGVALGVGTPLLAWWLIAAATGSGPYEDVRAFINSIPGRLILLGFTFSLFYHLCNGIRHLVWDSGVGFDIRTSRASGWIVLAVAVTLTLASWQLGYTMRGLA
jgi:succinate dehydrogenase / fumarate reductase cytochrome b subunit